MLNLVEKFTPAAIEATNDDGVVTIEYVVLGGAVVALIAATVWTGLGTKLTTEINSWLP